MTLDQLMGEFATLPEVSAQLPAARRELAHSLYADEPESFSALRLAAGLSQQELAQRSGTSQPHIARIESGRNDPGTDLIARLAEALGVEPARLFTAIRYQRRTRGAK